MKLWARDSGLLLVSQLLATLATSVLAVLVARTLGPSDFGVFAGFLALSFAMTVLIELGVGAWLLRELSARREGANSACRHGSYELLVGALALTGLLGVTVVISALGVAAALGTSAELTLVLAALLGYTTCLGASGAIEAAFRASRSLKAVVFIVTLEKTVLLIAVATSVVLDLGLSGISLAYMIAGATRLTSSASLAYSRGRIGWVRPSSGLLRYVAKSSLPFALNSGLTSILVRLDPAVIGLISATAAGLFAVGDRVVGALLVVPVIGAGTLYPHLAGSHNVARAARRASWVLGAIGVAGSVIGMISAPFLIPALFGPRFSEAVAVVQVMLCSLPFMFASGPIMAGLYTLGLERRVIPFTAVSVLLGTGLIVGGQLLFGALGAASGYLTRQVCFAAVVFALLKYMDPQRRHAATVPSMAIRQQ